MNSAQSEEARRALISVENTKTATTAGKTNMAGLARYMRTSLGFFPTNGKNDDEWKMYNKVVTNVTAFLRKNSITGANIRGNFSLVNEWVVEEAKDLLQDTESDKSLHSLLSSVGACESFIYAVLYAVVGSYDAYRQKARD